MMNVWVWFAAPPAALLAAYFALPSVQKSVTPLAPPPEIARLNLPAGLGLAEGTGGYRRGGAPKDIRLSAFGVVVPDEVAGAKGLAMVPPAKDLFALQAILVAGDSRTATLNDKIYRVGDRVQRRYRLDRVEADAVWLKGPRGREVLRFPEFKDPPPPPAPLPGVAPVPVAGNPALTGAAGRPGIPGVGSLDADYKKILEMLKL